MAVPFYTGEEEEEGEVEQQQEVVESEVVVEAQSWTFSVQLFIEQIGRLLVRGGRRQETPATSPQRRLSLTSTFSSSSSSSFPCCRVEASTFHRTTPPELSPPRSSEELPSSSSSDETDSYGSSFFSLGMTIEYRRVGRALRQIGDHYEQERLETRANQPSDRRRCLPEPCELDTKFEVSFNVIIPVSVIGAVVALWLKK